ncbi:hypothetical protein D3C79_969180 [compost metagenome]
MRQIQEGLKGVLCSGDGSWEEPLAAIAAWRSDEGTLVDLLEKRVRAGQEQQKRRHQAPF